PVRRAHPRERGGVADAAQVAPERARDRAIPGIADRADDLAVLDELPVFAAELELVAAVVDRPRRVGLQVHAVLDGRHQVVERRLARLDVEVGDAVYRWAVPPRCPRVGDTVESGALLRHRAAEPPQQDAVL